MPFSKAKQLLGISIFTALCLIAKTSSAVRCKGGLSAFNYHYAHELTQTDLWERASTLENFWMLGQACCSLGGYLEPTHSLTGISRAEVTCPSA